MIRDGYKAIRVTNMQNQKQVKFDPEFKNDAVARVDGGMTAAAVARDLSLPGWLVQNWVRSARGLNKRQKKKVLRVIDDRVFVCIAKFAATDAKNQTHQLLRLRPKDCKSISEFGELLVTSKNEKVTRIMKGVYKTESGLILENPAADAF